MKLYDASMIAVIVRFYGYSYTGTLLVYIRKNASIVHNDIIPKCKKI